ncbi:MAG: cell division protein FtsL [Actinomycetota bacterium]|nr:cell division protein FtsL [Actinomycetota bacterium]
MSSQKQRSKKKKAPKGKAEKKPGFWFLISVSFVITLICVFSLVLLNFAAANAAKEEKVQSQIEEEKSKQRDLRGELARLKSPERISRIAEDQLGMAEPSEVVYLRYKGDGSELASSRTYKEKAAEHSQRGEKKEKAEVTINNEEPASLSRR